MTLEQAFMTALGLSCGILGWLGRELWGAVQQLRRDLSTLEARIAGEYIRYDRMQDALGPIMKKLDSIEQTLTHKVDKP